MNVIFFKIPDYSLEFSEINEWLEIQNLLYGDSSRIALTGELSTLKEMIESHVKSDEWVSIVILFPLENLKACKPIFKHLSDITVDYKHTYLLPIIYGNNNNFVGDEGKSELYNAIRSSDTTDFLNGQVHDQVLTTLIMTNLISSGISLSSVDLSLQLFNLLYGLSQHIENQRNLLNVIPDERRNSDRDDYSLDPDKILHFNRAFYASFDQDVLNSVGESIRSYESNELGDLQIQEKLIAFLEHKSPYTEEAPRISYTTLGLIANEVEAIVSSSIFNIPKDDDTYKCGIEDLLWRILDNEKIIFNSSNAREEDNRLKAELIEIVNHDINECVQLRHYKKSFISIKHVYDEYNEQEICNSDDIDTLSNFQSVRELLHINIKNISKTIDSYKLIKNVWNWIKNLIKTIPVSDSSIQTVKKDFLLGRFLFYAAGILSVISCILASVYFPWDVLNTRYFTVLLIVLSGSVSCIVYAWYIRKVQKRWAAKLERMFNDLNEKISGELLAWKRKRKTIAINRAKLIDRLDKKVFIGNLRSIYKRNIDKLEFNIDKITDLLSSENEVNINLVSLIDSENTTRKIIKQNTVNVDIEKLYRDILGSHSATDSIKFQIFKFIREIKDKYDKVIELNWDDSKIIKEVYNFLSEPSIDIKNKFIPKGFDMVNESLSDKYYAGPSPNHYALYQQAETIKFKTESKRSIQYIFAHIKEMYE